jgi:Aldo/keto reductase family/4'-phosphopantetheinyl transferase N-terminal domain
MLELVLPAGVETEERFGAVPGGVLFPEEEKIIAQAAQTRRRDFAAVRSCARACLERLSYPQVPILPGVGGAPTWPAGVRGSMTHCTGCSATPAGRGSARVESSLRSLGTEYADIYQVHRPDLHTPPEETAGALEELVAEGKIRHVGVSNYAVDEMHALDRFGRVETLQPPYHLFRREIEETILPYAPLTTLACWCTGRSPMACSPDG